jgi:hypothetical protein
MASWESSIHSFNTLSKGNDGHVSPSFPSFIISMTDISPQFSICHTIQNLLRLSLRPEILLGITVFLSVLSA